MTVVSRSASGVVAVTLAATAAFGCHSVPVTYKTPAAGSYDVTAGKHVSSSACGVQLSDVIPIGTNDRQARAYEALQRNAPSSVLTGIKQQERWYYIYVGELLCTSLTATAYPTLK